MLQLQNLILAVDLYDILVELRDQLNINGYQYFNKLTVTQDNIMTNCPYHGNGQERKPSCGIHKTTGQVHCFACGATTNLEEMISNCFGKNDFGTFGREWLVKNFMTIAIEDRKAINLDLSRSQKTSQLKYITEEELSNYRFYHPYMYKRRLTNEIIDLFDIGYDNNFKLGDKTLRCLTFPVKDMNGNVLFVARRSVDTKFFHYPEGVDKPVYGLFELPKDVDEVIVCESMLNALTCWTYGKHAVALLGLGTDAQYQQLRKLPCRKIITALDPDSAGQRATAKLKKALYNKIVTSYVVPEGKDINDLEFDEFMSLEEIF